MKYGLIKLHIPWISAVYPKPKTDFRKKISTTIAYIFYRLHDLISLNLSATFNIIDAFSFGTQYYDNIHKKSETHQEIFTL